MCVSIREDGQKVYTLVYVVFSSFSRHRLTLMREIYNEDLSPDTPEAKQDIFHCLSACGQQNVFNFRTLIPSRSGYLCMLFHSFFLSLCFSYVINICVNSFCFSPWFLPVLPFKISDTSRKNKTYNIFTNLVWNRSLFSPIRKYKSEGTVNLSDTFTFKRRKFL